MAGQLFPCLRIKWYKKRFICLFSSVIGNGHLKVSDSDLIYDMNEKVATLLSYTFSEVVVHFMRRTGSSYNRPMAMIPSSAQRNFNQG